MKKYAGAQAAANAYVECEPQVRAQDLSRIRVQSSRREPTTPSYALAWTELSRFYAHIGREVARWQSKGGRVLWACYQARFLDGSRATPSYAALARAFNRTVGDEHERISKATMRRRLGNVHDFIEAELISWGMHAKSRTGDERVNQLPDVDAQVEQGREEREKRRRKKKGRAA